MNLLIFNLGDNDWFFADAPTGQPLPPFAIQGAFLSYRLWRADGLTDDQWDAAKAFFIRLAGELRKPGRKVRAA